jgi:SRSO17 transposase
MTILEHPQAQELLEAASITPDQVAGCASRLSDFLARYLPLFARSEQRAHAETVIEGKLSGLDRKTSEPVANQAGVPRKPIQSFVGWGAWDDETLMAELRAHVREEWADPDAVLVIDPSSFPKKGAESCGVQRQWCGRLGKVENCQVGVFLFYACARGHAPLDRRLFLPREWADDEGRREKAHVPAEVAYQERWQIALDMVRRARAEGLPHSWVSADSEFGRAARFRAELRRMKERYLVDVPENLLARDLDERVEQPARRHGSPKKAPWRNVKEWAESQPAGRWRRFAVRAGEKGPLEVDALMARVQTMQDGRVGPEERLVVTRGVADPREVWYRLAPAGELELPEAVRAGGERHRAEQVLQEGKGEVGLGQYEVRSWVGWHHHATLCLLALWFLSLERVRVGGEKDGGDGEPVEASVREVVAVPRANRGANRRRDQPRAAA